MPPPPPIIAYPDKKSVDYPAEYYSADICRYTVTDFFHRWLTEMVQDLAYFDMCRLIYDMCARE